MLSLKLPKKVQKRDGRIVTFKKSKIVDALYKAGKATAEFELSHARMLASNVRNILSQRYKSDILAVEEIQDVVEEVLIKEGLVKTAKAYILYRDLHARIRDISAFIVSKELVNDYLGRSDWRIKENSNMFFSLQGLNHHISSTISAHFWLNEIYEPDIKEAHNSGALHIHDMQLLGPYCVGWDLKDLLIRGFGGVSGKVESRPPKHFSSALGQLVNFLYTLQGESAGAQAVANFDTLLAPFIAYDKLDYAEVKQCLQEFVYNMNVSTRVGFQTPFTNVTLDLTVPKILANENVIRGGLQQDRTYSEFQSEISIFNRAFAEVLQEGDAKGRVFTFPIPTYNITKNFDWENKVLDPIWEMTAKYGIPYFSNFVNSDMDPDDARSMCCRLRLDNRELRKRGGGLFGANPLTGSIGVVTINLPRIGYLAESKTDYFDRLFKVMDTAQRSLENKREVLEKLSDDGLYPYSIHYLDSVKRRYGKYWKNHFSTIGLVGMNESLLNYMGKEITSSTGHAFAEEILDKMRSKILEYQEQTGNLYNLEATPAEATSFRLAKADKKLYPEIIVANEDVYKIHNSPYYTNSSHLPVGYTDDLFQALDLQDSLQTKYTGGTVFHSFLGQRVTDAHTTKQLVRKISENYSLPYYTLTPTFSICPEHGYIIGEHHLCPTCQNQCEVYSRVVGYLRPVEQWNDGKKAEFHDRQGYYVS